MEVHRNLGCGFFEAVYQEALEIELQQRGIPHLREHPLTICYKGIPLQKEYTPDFICYDRMIVELKALGSLESLHEAQVINYLKATGYQLGLLINFGELSLNYKRIVY
jgi:GxxExxY protein